MSTRDDHALIEETRGRGRMKALSFMGILLGLVFAAGGGSFGRSSAEASALTLVTRSAAATGSAQAGARIAVSSGDRKIAFVRSVGRFRLPSWYELYVMDPDGSGKRRLVRSTLLYHLSHLAWSPDRRKLVFAAHLGRSAQPCDRGGPCNKEIFVINADGSGLQRLTRNAGEDSAPAWSPNGQKIAWTTRGQGTGTDVFVMSADGSDQQDLTPKPGNQRRPRWSPDGHAILFTAAPPGQPRLASGVRFSDVYVMNADGSGQRNLTQTRAGGEGNPAWSPDGQHIAFSRVLVAGPPWGGRIVVMNADGSGKHAVAAVTHKIGDTIGWSPDGRRIAFDDDDAIYVVNADGSGLRPLAENAAFQSWSPNGRKLIFARALHPHRGPPASAADVAAANNQGGADLWVMNVDGSGQRNLTRDGRGGVEATWAR